MFSATRYSVTRCVEDKSIATCASVIRLLLLFDKLRRTLTLSLPSSSKNQYISAKHVSMTPEYLGYMGSTQSISRTIQPIAVKLAQNVDII